MLWINFSTYNPSQSIIDFWQKNFLVLFISKFCINNSVLWVVTKSLSIIQSNHWSASHHCRWRFGLRIYNKSNGFTNGCRCTKYSKSLTRNAGLCQQSGCKTFSYFQWCQMEFLETVRNTSLYILIMPSRYQLSGWFFLQNLKFIPTNRKFVLFIVHTLQCVCPL